MESYYVRQNPTTVSKILLALVVLSQQIEPTGNTTEASEQVDVLQQESILTGINVDPVLVKTPS